MVPKKEHRANSVLLKSMLLQFIEAKFGTDFNLMIQRSCGIRLLSYHSNRLENN
jgi:hypothetical protein